MYSRVKLVAHSLCVQRLELRLTEVNVYFFICFLLACGLRDSRGPVCLMEEDVNTMTEVTAAP